MSTSPQTKNRRASRILLVIPDVAACTGGIAMVSRSLMRMLEKKASSHSIDYRVVAMRGPSDDDEAAQLRSWVGGRLRHFNNHVASFSVHVLWKMSVWSDVVIFTHVGPASLLTMLPAALRPASTTFVHGREVWQPLGMRHRNALLKSDLVISNSAFTASKAREANPWLDAINCCHLGIPKINDEEPLDPPVASSISPGPKDILVVGRMVADEPGKGHEQLIGVMDEVLKQVPQARLIVVGSGSAKDHLHAVARKTGANGRIVFTGYLPEPTLRRLYRQSAVFAMPSRQDGFGLVYLEAMREGLPCIASDADGGQEVVSDGQVGFHVRLGDKEALAAALIEILKNDELRQRLGAAARKRFESMFTEEQFHNRFWKLLGRCLN